MGIGTDIALMRKTQQGDIAWKLLRSAHAPAIITILDAHLGGSTNRLTVSELVALVETDLEELRERFPEIDLPRSAKEYCEQWRKDGYLKRRPSNDARVETYELSAGALAGIAFAKGLEKPHRVATKSRLDTIINQISSLSLATDHDIRRRRNALLAERERIDEQLHRLDEGIIDVIDERQALEQAHDIISLAQEIPRDFVSVRMDFEEISKHLYTQLISCSEGHQKTLDDIFAGVDHIAQSPAGLSFRGFYNLLRDVEASESLQDDIDAILDTDYSMQLDLQDRRFLRNLIRLFGKQGIEVNETMTVLARGLRRLVQSHSFQQDRLLKRKIDQALAHAAELSETCKPTSSLQIDLQLTTTPVAPISRLSLNNPLDSKAEPIEDTRDAPAYTLSFEDLRAMVREVEIDYEELAANVNECIRLRAAEAVAAGRSLPSHEAAVSIADVLERFPATQGAASIVGLMTLASSQGAVDSTGEPERVSWVSANGVSKHASIVKHRFVKEVVW